MDADVSNLILRNNYAYEDANIDGTHLLNTKYEGHLIADAFVLPATLRPGVLSFI